MIPNFRVAAVATLSIGLLTTACKKSDSPAVDTTSAMPPASAPATTPIRVASIETGKSLNADKHVTDQTSDFGVRDTLRVAVITEGAASGANLRAKFTYGAKLVKEMNQMVTATGGTNVTNFDLDKASAWPKGAYKVEIFLDGVSAGTKDLTVK